MISQALLNLVDTVMVSTLGPEALAGVGTAGFAALMASTLKPQCTKSKGLCRISRWEYQGEVDHLQYNLITPSSYWLGDTYQA